MNKIFTLNKLSDEFYKNYPQNLYPEIEHKPTRPYIVLIVLIGNNKFALPLRTNIRHNYCYKFKSSGRQTESSSGIDYSKAVIVNNPSFIGDPATIDKKEFIELSNKYYFIVEKFVRYLNNYIEFRKNDANELIARKYQFTTLKYFDRELGLL